MSAILYTVPGCVRCRVAGSFLDNLQCAYQEKDIQGKGKDDFQKLYRQHRSRIHRGKEGIEFPILEQNERIIQGIGPICAWLQAGNRLSGVIGRSQLSHGWVDGLHLAQVDPADEQDVLAVLTHLKRHGLFLQPNTDGRNPSLLARVIENRLADRLLFYLLGPVEIHALLTGTGLDAEILKQSLQLAVQCPEYEFVLRVVPVFREDGGCSYLTPEEAARTTAQVEQATGSKKHPFFIEAVPPAPEQDLVPLEQSALFKYRTACRRYQVLTDIRKELPPSSR